MIDSPIHELIAEQAARTPDAPALVLGQDTLTYRELERRSNQLAHRLRRAGVGPELLVAITMDRSFEMIVAILGVLKSGGAYLPIDPKYPRERVTYLLGDARPHLVLTQPHLRAVVPETVPVLVLGARWEEIESEPAESPGIPVSQRSLAYVIYTSGSTGQPKGVLVEHGAICNLVHGQLHAFGIGRSDRILQFSSASFDASVWEIFVSLSLGATLYLASSEELRPGPGLAALMRRCGITLLLTTPSVLAAIPEADLPALRVVASGGEVCPPALAARWSPGRRFVNVYGPTEATVIMMVADVVAPMEAKLPIGRPFEGMAAYVLDEHGQPAAPGVACELLIGGAGVARGYLGNPALTAARFVPDPFSKTPGARAYRTGDYVQRRADGQLDFVGRHDDQVKVRGFRIELGEVESRLTELADVASAAVLTTRTPIGDTVLVGFVVPKGRDPLSGRELRARLAAVLPDYMVPSAILSVGALPRTAVDKLDRDALLARYHDDAARQWEPPRTETERALAAVWSDALGVPRVGIRHNFLALGGSSLRAAQVALRIGEVLEAEVTSADVLATDDLAAMAAIVDERRRAPTRSDAPRLAVTEHALTRPQERLWLLEKLDPDHPWSGSFWLPIAGELQIPILERALDELVRRHDVLRTHLIERDGKPIAHVVAEAQVHLDILDVSHEPEAARDRLARECARDEGARSYDLLAPPPWIRFVLVRLSPREHRLVVGFHHLFWDGWSCPVFARDLLASYDAMIDGSSGALPPRAQFADHVHDTQTQLAAGGFDDDIAYWKRVLADPPPVLALPTDRPRGQTTCVLSGAETAVIPASVVERLRDFGRGQRATLFMSLLAGFCVVLQRYTGQSDLVIGSSAANRERRAFQDAIGYFANTIPLRIQHGAAMSFRELLADVRAVCLDAYVHQGGQLLQDAETDYRVCFLLQDFVSQIPSSRHLELGYVHLEGPTHFDLSVSIEERGSELHAIAIYDPALFDATTIQQLLERWITALDELATFPDRSLSATPIVSAREQQQLASFGAAKQRVPEVETIIARFERQAKATPENVALVHDNCKVTYRELDARADRLAARLRGLGVAPDDLVGLAASRSFDLVTGILAILKAGGAYLPLDPTYPRDRLAFMLDDAAPVALVIQAAHRGELPPFAGPVIEIASPAMPGEAAPPNGGAESIDEPTDVARAVPVARCGPDNLAYVIYTSGSTGRPKGVMITHAHVLRLLDATHAWFGFDASDVWTLFHSYAFDFSVWELWGALLYGGRLVVVPYWASRSPETFHQLVVDEGVTVLNQTPSAFRQFIAADKSADAPMALRFVIFGGEALDLQALAPWFERHGDARPQLVNMFGITETTVHVTYRPIHASDLASGASPIGIPIPDLSLYVLDDRQARAPIGLTGEIHVGGAGVARGYLRRPALTAERFVPDPFSPVPGSRMYRSGDLGKWRRDGDLEFLGRGDEQVKIRGFRIEPGEIAAVIASHPGVEDAVVVPRSTGLVAYVIPDAGEARVVRELVTATAERVELANGMTVFCLDDKVDPVDLRHGISLRDGDCVFDIGANVGAFSLFVSHRVKQARVIACEPIPAIYDVLARNLEMYGVQVEALNLGISDRSEFSQLAYDGQEVTCRMTSLSELVRHHGVAEIHLLNIDVDNSDDVMRGIEPEHWPRIAQIVVHDSSSMRDLLAAHGFEVRVDNRTLYAKRPAFRPDAPETDEGPLHLPAWTSTTQFVASLRERTCAQLPDYMQPSAFVLVERFPLTANGKLDRRALPAPDARPAAPKRDEAPATPLEQELVQLWTELLGVPVSSTNANFFELGGHSILLVQLANRIRASFGIELQLRVLFDTPTIARLADEITKRVAALAQDDALADLLTQIEGLSPEEAQQLLGEVD